MKHLFFLLSIVLAETALAHPGHGKPGFIHSHEWADAALIVSGLLVAGILCWRLWKR